VQLDGGVAGGSARGTGLVFDQILNCLFINVHSILNNLKIDELQAYDVLHDLHIIGIAESWLNDRVDNSEIQIDNFIIYRRDRDGGSRGGGVLLYVHDSLVSSECAELTKFNTEAVWCKILTGSNVDLYI